MKMLLVCLLSFAAGHAQSDKVKFAAEISNRNSDSIVIVSRTFKKVIHGKDGKFADAFSVEPGIYNLFDGTEYANLYLQNGYDLLMTMDAKHFDESIKFMGTGEKENNFLAQKTRSDAAWLANLDVMMGDPDALQQSIEEYKKKSDAALADKTLNENFRKVQANDQMQFVTQMNMLAAQARNAAAIKGKPSPVFDYENFKGGTTKLSDLKGKYVYIDIWATWCGPCRAEIPHLQAIEEKYKGKNIVFASISVDVAKDHDKWKKMVTEKNLGGMQLFADKDWNSDFITAYGVNNIPRFLLIGPDGTVLDADAKRPSNAELSKQLDALIKYY